MRSGIWIPALILSLFLDAGLNAQVVLPESGRLAGPIDPTTSEFGDEFFNFPAAMGAGPPPGQSALSGWLAITFSAPEGNLVDFDLAFDTIGSDDLITFEGGQSFAVAWNRVMSTPLLPSAGTLDLETGQIVDLQINPLARNTTIAPVSRINRIPFAFAASYPPPDLEPLGITPEQLPPELFEPGFLSVQAAFTYDPTGRITGFQFSGQTVVLVGLLAQLNPQLPPESQIFPPAAFGPGGESYFANPISCEPHATYCPTYEENPDGIGLPPDAFYRPHTSLGSDSLHEVPAARDAHSCLPSGRARGLLIAAQGKLYLIGGVSGGRNPDDDTVIYDPAAGEWVSGPPLPVAVMDAQGVVIGSKIYVFGGYAQDQRISDRLQILDTATGAWTDGARGPMKIANGVAGAVGGQLYVLGGRRPFMGEADLPAGLQQRNTRRKEPRRPENPVLYNKKVLTYTPATDSWEILAVDPPVLGEGAAAAVLGTEIYVLGGQLLDLTGRSSTISRQVSIFDTVAGSFSRGQDLLQGVWEAAAGWSGEQLFVVGGRTARNGPSTAAVQVLIDGRWVRGLPVPIPVASAAAADLDGEVVVVGGLVESLADVPEVVVPAVQEIDAGLGWAVCDSLPLFIPDSLLSSASLTVGPRHPAPGSVAILEGLNFGMSAADLSVTVGGLPATVLSVVPGRVDLHIPAEVEPGVVDLEVTREGSPQQAPVTTIRLDGVAPGIFVETYWETRDPLFLDAASAIACNADSYLNHASDPAAHGEQVTFQVTGLGTASPAEVAVYVDDICVVPDTVMDLGLGLFAVIVTIPDGTRSANRVPFWLSVGGVLSNRASLAVGEVASPRQLPCPLW